MAGIKIVDLPALGRDLAATDLLELSLAGGTGSRKITGQEIINASKLNVGTTPIINGAVGQVLFQGTGNVLQESANLFWDNTNARLGIGVTNPSQKLSIVGNNFLMFTGVSAQNMPAYIGTDSSDNFYVYSAGQGSGKSAYYGPSSGTHLRTSSGSLDLSVGNGAPILGLRLNSTGNILIGTTTDAGFRLDVNGTARFKDTGSAASIIMQYGTGGWITVNNAGGTEAIRLRGGGGASWFNTGQNVLIGTTTDDGFKLDVNGTARVQGNFQVSAGVARFTSTIYPNIEVNSTQRYSIIEFLNTQSAKAAVALDNTDKYLDLSGYPTYGVRFNVNNTEAARFNNSTRNLLINTTTDAGFRLDVNGSMRATVSTETNPFVIQHTNGNSATIIIGNGSQLAAGQMGMYFNGSPIWTWNGSAFRLPGNIISTQNNPSTLLISGGWGGSTLGTSLRLSSNTGNQGVFTATSGTQSTVEIGNAANETWSPSSGNATYNILNVIPRFNTTGTYSGIARGFYYNPTLTSTTGLTHFAFHSTSGRVRFEGLPTSPTGLNAGDIYNDGGILKIV